MKHFNKILIAIIFLFLSLLYIKDLRNLRECREVMNRENLKHKSFLLEKETDLSYRLKLEQSLFFHCIGDTNFSISDSTIYLYIPKPFCNDCMISVYDVLKEVVSKNNYFSLKILSPKETYRENKLLFKEFDCLVTNLKSSVTKPFLFKYKKGCIKHVLILNKNEKNTCIAYIKTLQENR